MTGSLTFAAAQRSGGIPSPLTILLVVAGVGYVLWSRTQGRPLKARRMVVLPVLFIVLGVTDLSSSTAPHLSDTAIGFLLAGAIVSIVLGAARGSTVELYPTDGELWQRYRRSTVALWIALIVARIVLTVIAHGAGGAAGAGTNSLMLTLGLSLLAEAAVIAPRALSTGLPLAPSQGRRESRPAPQLADEPAWQSPRAHDGADRTRRQINVTPEQPASETTTVQGLTGALKQHHEDHRQRHQDRHARHRRH